MKLAAKAPARRPLGRVSIDTKGPPGAHMEVSGLWDKATQLN